MSDVLGVIPARFEASRFPGKVLVQIRGKTMLEWVHASACRAGCFSDVIIATDSECVADAARGWGAHVRMTSREHACGLDRVAEVARDFGSSIVCDIQADQPFIPAHAIAQCVDLVRSGSGSPMATLATLVRSEGAYRDPNVVKVVVDGSGNALYFSRSPVPYSIPGVPSGFLKHHGVYCLKKDVLLDLAGSPQSKLEVRERLEQLRALERGIRIRVGICDVDWVSVNTPQDVEELERTALERIRR